MKTFLSLCRVLPLLVLGSLAFAQPIYRVVDEQGNVTYTDRKPSEDAEPLALPELNVVGTRGEPIAEIIAVPDPDAPDQDAPAPSLELAIVEPPDGSSRLLGPLGQLDLRIEANFEIPLAAQIVLFLNDIPQEPINQLSASLAGLPPGQHRLRAELQTPSGRVLTASEEIRVTLLAETAPETEP